MDELYRLLCIEEIRQLKARYFRLLDGKDFEGLATIFCADAQFDARASFTPYPKSGDRLAQLGAQSHATGRDAIIEFISTGTAGLVTAHHGHSHEITIDGKDRAHGVIAMEDYIRTPGGGTLLHGMGHYHEDYRIENGVWRIHRSVITRLFVDVDLNLVEAAGPA